MHKVKKEKYFAVSNNSIARKIATASKKMPKSITVQVYNN